ncbi:hypothetical protein ACFXPS_44425 [Nocardia sp. NPDC059091]|uniref:hypothetical protein n=1 Tax=unclassified Nocardia TaxID=2637762 RepID=UPI0036B2CC8E
MKQFEQLLAGEVAFHLSRLGVGGGDPAQPDRAAEVSTEYPLLPRGGRFEAANTVRPKINAPRSSQHQQRTIMPN